jgi:hypothetical protein
VVFFLTLFPHQIQAIEEELAHSYIATIAGLISFGSSAHARTFSPN